MDDFERDLDRMVSAIGSYARWLLYFFALIGFVAVYVTLAGFLTG